MLQFGLATLGAKLERKRNRQQSNIYKGRKRLHVFNKTMNVNFKIQIIVWVGARFSQNRRNTNIVSR